MAPQYSYFTTASLLSLSRALPARWCSVWSVRFAVGRPGVHFPCRAIPKDFKKWYSQLPCLVLSTSGIVWRTSRQAYLWYPWARHLTGCLRLYVADRWWGQQVYPSWWTSLTKDMQTEHELTRVDD